MTFVLLHHVWKGTRFSPSLSFVVVVQGESLGTRLTLYSAYPSAVGGKLYTCILLVSIDTRLHSHQYTQDLMSTAKHCEAAFN